MQSRHDEIGTAVPFAPPEHFHCDWKRPKCHCPNCHCEERRDPRVKPGACETIPGWCARSGGLFRFARNDTARRQHRLSRQPKRALSYRACARHDIDSTDRSCFLPSRCGRSPLLSFGAYLSLPTIDLPSQRSTIPIRRDLCRYNAGLATAARSPPRSSPYSIAVLDFAISRSTNFWIFPVDVFGISRKTNVFGTLNRAMCSRQKSRSSSAVAE